MQSFMALQVLSKQSSEMETAVVVDGHATDVERLLKAGAAPDAPYGKRGERLVDAAAQYGHFEVVRLLLRHLPDTDPRRAQALLREAVQNQKNFALGDAAERGTVAKVQAALAAGGQINASTSFGTPLKWALLWNTRRVVRFLLARGADANEPSRNGGAPLMVAVSRNPLRTRLQLLHLLVTRGAEVNAQDADGKTVLMMAALDGDAPTLKTLLTDGADPNLSDKDGVTALMLASYYNLSLSSPYDEAMTPAEARLRRDKVRLLRRYGANPRLVDKHGRAAADYRHIDFYDGPGS